MFVNKTKDYGCFIVAMLAVLVCNFTYAKSSCRDKPISIAWHEFKPYSYYAPNGDKVIGKDIRMLSRILDKLGCQRRFVYMTWPRTLTEVSNGSIDMSMYAYQLAERKGMMLFSKPYRAETVNVAVLESNTQLVIDTVEDLFSQKLTVVADLHAWQGEEFERLYAANPGNFVHVHDPERRMLMLLNSRSNAIIGDRTSLLEEAGKLRSEHLIKILPLELYRNEVHFIFNPKTIDHSFVSRFNDVLDRLRGE